MGANASAVLLTMQKIADGLSVTDDLILCCNTTRKNNTGIKNKPSLKLQLIRSATSINPVHKIKAQPRYAMDRDSAYIPSIVFIKYFAIFVTVEN